MTYKLLLMQTALDDLEEIVLYIAKDNKAAAMKMHDKIMERAKKLTASPKLGMPVPFKKIGDRGFRMTLVEKYILFYKVYEDEIRVLRILHGARNYPILFEKER